MKCYYYIVFIIFIILIIYIYFSSTNIIKQNHIQIQTMLPPPPGLVMGTANDNPVSNFLVADATGNITTFSIPIGTIVMYNGTTAPVGWAICDGTNNTPDLRGRFAIGYNPANTGNSNLQTNIFNTIGNKDMCTLTIKNLPAHSHMFDAYNKYLGDRRVDNGDYTAVGPNADSFQSKATNNTGENVPFDIRPAYYVVNYIIKII